MLYRDYLKSKYQNTAVKLANAEGVPCVLESSKGKNMRNYEVYGNSVQDGTPTPESPVEIQSVGDLVTDTESEYYGKYDIPITVTGTRSETTHIYLDEPLRKVGDYADYIDFKNQKIVRKIAKKTYIGQSNEAWNNGSSDNHIKYIIPVPNDFSNGYGLEGTYGLSNIFVCKFANEAHTFYFTGDKSNSWRRNVFYNDTELTVDEWKSKLTEWNEIGNPLTIYYPLLTSREETISLPALKTFKGTNVMSVDTSIQPSNIKANYIRT